MTPDLAHRWNAYVNECMAEWDIGEDLTYTPGHPAQEPRPVLNTNDAGFYAVWLYEHGYITKVEERWLLADIARARDEA